MFWRGLVTACLFHGEAVAGGEGFKVGLPHEVLAIDAKALLACKGLGAKSRESGRHGGLSIG